MSAERLNKQSWKGNNTMRTSSPIHIRKILVPIDFSPESVKPLVYAGAIAKTHGAKVILLHVTTPVCLHLDYGYGPVARYGEDELVVRRCRTRLRSFAKKHLTPHYESEIIIATGKPIEKIVYTAKDQDVDLIILYAHPERRTNELHSHETVEAVSRFAPCPVLVVRPREHDFVGRQNH
jgi:nucleotide-binding universal stress UspA family protein